MSASSKQIPTHPLDKVGEQIHTNNEKLNRVKESLVPEYIPCITHTRIIFKRIHINPLTFNPGHWWVEIYSSEWQYNGNTLDYSYGWYPFVDNDGDGRQDCNIPYAEDGICYDAVRPGLWKGFRGVTGRLNRGYTFDPLATPKSIEWNVQQMFHPITCDGRTTDSVIACIKSFATSHAAEWAWPQMEADEDHCQTFQMKILEHCNLYTPRQHSNVNRR